MAEVNIIGLDNLQLVMQSIPTNANQYIDYFTLNLANEILELSQQQVPVATGDLRDSAGIDHEGGGGQARSYVYYDTYYALYVHERLDIQHRNGKAKYLEDPANQVFATVDAEAQKTFESAILMSSGISSRATRSETHGAARKFPGIGRSRGAMSRNAVTRAMGRINRGTSRGRWMRNNRF